MAVIESDDCAHSGEQQEDELYLIDVKSQESVEDVNIDKELQPKQKVTKKTRDETQQLIHDYAGNY